MPSAGNRFDLSSGSVHKLSITKSNLLTGISRRGILLLIQALNLS